MPEQSESAFQKFIRLNPDYPNCSEANIPLFEFIRTHGNDFTSSDSFAAAWTALRSEIIQAVSSANAEKFLAECKDYPGGAFNAGLMDAFIASQVGRDRVWTKENYLAGYEYLKSENTFATEVEYTAPEKKAEPIHPAHSLAEAMTAREAEEAKVRKLRKMSALGKPVSKALRALATKERRNNIAPNRLSQQDKFPEHVQI
jgi:hypothetical protein